MVRKTPEEKDYDSRTAYGERRAAREDEMMTAHAEQVYEAGVANKKVSAKLRQPWHTTGELNIKYGKDYLSQHPEYTGRNAQDMPTYEEALKKQAEKDKELEEWLDDEREGNVDDYGRVVAGEDEHESEDDQSDSEDSEADDSDLDNDDDMPASDPDNDGDQGSSSHGAEDQSNQSSGSNSPGAGAGDNEKDDRKSEKSPESRGPNSGEDHCRTQAPSPAPKAARIQPYQRKYASPKRQNARAFAVSPALHRKLETRKEASMQKLCHPKTVSLTVLNNAYKTAAEHQGSKHSSVKRAESKLKVEQNDTPQMGEAKTVPTAAETKGKKRKNDDAVEDKPEPWKKIKLALPSQLATVTKTAQFAPAISSPLATAPPLLATTATPKPSSVSKTSTPKVPGQGRAGSTETPAPLQPSPGKPDYKDFKYYELAALCRERELPGAGKTEVLRNRLIQDDIDIEQGNERVKRKWKPSRRNYKTSPPKVVEGA